MPTYTSTEEIARVDETLEKLNGNRSLAAQALGISKQDLANLIYHNKALLVKWAKKVEMPENDPARDKAPVLLSADDEAALEAKQPPPGVTAKDIQVADAHNQIDLKLQRLGWEGLGITGPTAQLMESFEKFTGGKILRTIDATHGGMMFGFAHTSARLEYLAKKLDEPGVKENPELESMYHTQFMECSDQMRKFNAEATKAAHVRALIQEKANEAQSKKRNAKTPKWLRAKQVGGKKT